VSHRFSIPAQSSLAPHPRWHRLYLQQVFGAMPHRRGLIGVPVTVTRLGRAAPLPLEHPNRDHLQGGQTSDPAGRRRPTRRPRPDARVLSGGDSPARGAARLPDHEVALSRGWHIATGHGAAAHVSLAPGPEPCSLIAAVAPRRLPRDVTCPVADRGGTSCIMRR